MKKIIESKYGLLIFSLLCGLSYYILIMMLISQVEYSYLLGMFFFPAIVCGAAIYLIKALKALIENEDMHRVRRIIVLHSVLIFLTLVYVVVKIIFTLGIFN